MSNSHQRLSFQRCSTNCQGQFRSSAAPRTVKDKFSTSHRKLSLQRCSTNCQGQFRSSAAPRTVKEGISNSHQRILFQRCSTNCQGQVQRLSFQRCSTNCQGRDLKFTPKTFAPALLNQLSRTESQIHTENFRSSAAPTTVKDKFSNSHQRLSLQRCSTNCQGRDLQFTPKTFVPTLLHQLLKTRSPINIEDFRSSAAPPTVMDRFSKSLRRLSLQRCTTNCQGQGFPIHTEDFRSSAAPPTVKDRFSNSRRRLSIQRCSTNCQGQVLQFTPKTFAPALLHQRQVLQFTPKTFAPPNVKDKISNSHRRLSLQLCSTNCQGQ